MNQYVVDPQSAGQRADAFVAQKYPQFARSSLKGLFSNQAVQVNNKTAKPGYKLKSGDQLLVDNTILQHQPKPINLEVIYEDKDSVVINKPAGVLTHSKGALNLESTVASFVQDKITDKELTGNRAGIIHRLDRGTSGVIICAKNVPAQKWLQKQFSARQAKKTYLAIVEGSPQPPEAVIDAPIGRNPKRPQTFSVLPSGKPAQTEYRTLKTLKKANNIYSLIELKPLTGRTHQIRVHLAYIGYPVFGDNVYGKEPNGPLYLHAHKLELTLPSGERREFIAPIPKLFKDFEKS